MSSNFILYPLQQDAVVPKHRWSSLEILCVALLELAE